MSSRLHTIWHRFCPHTPCKGSWLYTTMASAAAGAQGVRYALDVLMARGQDVRSG
jgi:hypothetical protein